MIRVNSPAGVRYPIENVMKQVRKSARPGSGDPLGPAGPSRPGGYDPLARGKPLTRKQVKASKKI